MYYTMIHFLYDVITCCIMQCNLSRRIVHSASIKASDSAATAKNYNYKLAVIKCQLNLLSAAAITNSGEFNFVGL